MEPPANMPTPTFMVIGAPKAGTTTLYHHLSNHPEIYLSDPKETHFLDVRIGHEPLERWSQDFAGYRGEHAIGEATPTYLTLPFVHDRLAKLVPDARLIGLLRDPVDRAYSDWWMYYARGKEPLSFGRAIEANLAAIEQGQTFEGELGAERWRKHYTDIVAGEVTIRAYLEHGYYATNLAHLVERFPRDQLQIFTLEDLKEQPEVTLNQIHGFLGVEPKPLKVEAGRKNLALGKHARPIWSALWGLNLHRLAATLPQAVRDKIKQALRALGRRPEIDPEISEELRTHYTPEIERLEKVLGRDLSSWKGPP